MTFEIFLVVHPLTLIGPANAATPTSKSPTFIATDDIWFTRITGIDLICYTGWIIISVRDYTRAGNLHYSLAQKKVYTFVKPSTQNSDGKLI